MFEVNEKNSVVLDSEHYDGETLKDVYGASYRPEGNKARYIETRVYLQQVRDDKRRVDLIKSRIQYRKEAGLDTSEAEQELAVVQDKLKRVTAEVAEEISKLYNVNLEMVMVKRYIDTLSWDAIAKTLDLKMRTVLKFHGKALPRRRRILLAAGLVELAVEAKADADVGTETEAAVQVPVAEDTGEEESDEYYND